MDQLKQLFRKHFDRAADLAGGRGARGDRRDLGADALESGARFQAAVHRRGGRGCRAAARQAARIGARNTGLADNGIDDAGSLRRGRRAADRDGVGGTAEIRPHRLRAVRQNQLRRQRVRRTGELSSRHRRRTGALRDVDPRSGAGAGAHHAGQGFAVHRAAPAGQGQRPGEAAARRGAIAAKRRRDLPAYRQRGAGTVAGSGFAGRHQRQPAEPAASAMRPATDRGAAKRRSIIARASSTTCRTKSPRRSNRCWARIIFAPEFRPMSI